MNDQQPLAWSAPYSPFIHACNASARPHPWRIVQRRLEYWLLVTSLDGEEEIRVDGHGYRIQSGASYLIQPGALHDLTSARGNAPAWIHFDLVFDPQRRQPRHWAASYDAELGDRARLLQPDARAVWGVDLPVPIPAALAPLFHAEVPALIARHSVGTPPARLETAARLGVLLARLVDQAWRGGTAEPAAMADRIAQAETVARQSLDTGFGLKAFAAAAGLGRSRFCQLYQAVRGVSPGEFLRRERLGRAESLLGGTSLPLTQIALLSGYGDATAFVRAFRAARGVTPGAWRAGRRR